MSAAIEDIGEALADRRERLLGETFMSTFAAIGALLLLDTGKADAALSDPTAAQPTSESVDPLRGAMASSEQETSGPPAVSDSAFLEAITALSPPPSLTTDMSSSTLGAAAPDPIAPSDDPPSTQPDEAANGALFTLPGSIAVVGSAQLSAYAGAATRTPEDGNEVAFAIGNDTINVLSGAAAPSVVGGVTLAGGPTQALGSLSHPAQASGSNDAVGAQASVQASLFNESASATVPGAGDRVATTSESETTSFANPAALIVADVVIDLSALFAFGAGYPGAFDLFAAQSAGGGDGLGFVSPDPWLTMAGVDKAELADFAGRGQLRLP